MAITTVTVELRFRWWLRAYIQTLQILCWATGMDVNVDRVMFWVKKGIKIELIPVKAHA